MGDTSLESLLDVSETVIGQPIVYPKGKPEIMAAYGALAPGEATGWHHHDIPIFIQILEGELTIDYGPAGVRKFKPGDSFIEAVGSTHNGLNNGSVAVKTFVVFIGSEDAQKTIFEED